MLRRKLAESLTVRIFLLTFLLLLGAGGLTFALIAWATPITYTAVISDRHQAQGADLTQQLVQTNLADAGPILVAFVRQSGAEVALTAPRGAEADTRSLLVLMGNRFYIANVGDSRVYLYRERRLSRLTRDQSVAEMRGLSEEESKRQGVQNKLTMCIGMFQIPQSIFCSGILKDGDCLLACSDGLYGPLGDDGTGAVLGAGADVSGKVAELRRQIGPGMARDNVSAVAAEIRM